MNDQPTLAESTNPVNILREAIAATLPRLQLVDESPDPAADIDAVLTTFARSVSPILDDLAAMAEADPDGPVAAALNQLRRAFNHRGTGTISPACRWQLERAHNALDRHPQH